MKKRIFCILSLMLCLVFCISAAACGKQDNGDTTDKHQAKSEWQWNEAEHWHDCATEGHTDKLEGAAHAFDAGVITVEATETATGEKAFTCTVCGYKKKEVLPALGHKHSFGTEWKTSDLNHWHECACGEKSEEEAHKFGEWNVIKPATETETGSKERLCSVCGYKETAEIPMEAHTHKFATEWTYDETNHWHASTCGHEVKEAEAAHNFNDGVITKEPTETAEGVKTYTCTVCGGTKTESVEKLPHTHTFDMANWEKNDTYHWHKATCEHTEEVKDKAAHTWNDGVITKPATETAEGEKTYTCGVCGYKKIEKIAKLPHTHKFDETKWTYDETNHWHASTCGHEVKEAEAAHNFNDGVITKEPTETAEGVKTFTCTVCGATKTESVPKLTHTHAFDMANWENDDTHHWHKATCGHTDEKNGYEEHKGSWTEKTPAGYGVDKVEERTCTVCKKHQERTVENSALAAKDNTVTVGTIDFTYNAKSQPIDSLITAGNKTGMFIKYVGVDGTTYEESTTAPTNAGTYQYTITIPATAEWKAAEKTGKFTIAKYELTVLYEKTHTTKEYDGNAMILVEYKSLEGTDVNIVILMKSKDVGTEIDRIQLPGILKDNYTYDQSKVTAEITPKKLSNLKITIQESDIDKEQDVVKFTMEIDGVNKEKVSVILEFYWEDLDNEEELQLTPDLPEKLGTGKCKITLKDAANYELNGNIGTLTLVR